MEQNTNRIAPEASTDERASSPHLSPEPEARDAAEAPPDWPEFATSEEAAAYWQGVRRGIREAGREPGHPHMPQDFSLDLTCDGAAAGLTSSKLLDAWPHDPADGRAAGLTTHGPAAPLPPAARAPREDGFTPAAEQLFLRTLADTGVVADACRATGISRQAAYARRRSAAGRAFALAWDAARLLARGVVADDVLSRSRHGVIERVYRDGALVAERHRYDNRLTMAVLSRLDRLAAEETAQTPVIRAVADEFDQFLSLLPHGLGAARAFLEARFAPTRAAPPPPPVRAEEALLDRLDRYERFGAGLPQEIEIGDLDPAAMEGWTDDQLARAEASGFLARLDEGDWPEAVRTGPQDETNGMCKIRQLYLRLHPPRPRPHRDHEEDIFEREDDFAGCGVWEDPAIGWLTDFPPPRGFLGYERGEPGTGSYERELADEERPLIEREEALVREEIGLVVAEQEEARRRFFDLPALGEEATSPSPSPDGEGDHAQHGGGVEGSKPDSGHAIR